MSTIINGADISTYKTMSIELHTAKNANVNGEKVNYLVLTVKPSNCFIAKPSIVVIFDDSMPGVYEILKPLATKGTVRGQECGIVDMKKFKESQDIDDDIKQGLTLIQGGIVLPYKFRKGLCYANRADGTRVLNKAGMPVTKDKVDVFCIINTASQNSQGGLDYTYMNGFDPDTQGQRIEDTFYKEPVINMTSVDTINQQADATLTQYANPAPNQWEPQQREQPASPTQDYNPPF